MGKTKSIAESLSVAPIELLSYDVCEIRHGTSSGKFTHTIINVPDEGVLTPPQYRFITNRNRLSVQLSQWALKQVAEIHPDFMSLLKNGFLTIYIPYKMFKNEQLSKALEGIKTAGKFNLQNLVLELTSDVLYENEEEVNTYISDIKYKYGVKFLLSEYGNEYCPALRMASFKFDYVIADNMICNEKALSSPATASAVNLAKQSGAKVIFGARATENLRAQIEATGFDFYISQTPMPIPDGRHTDV